MSCYVKMFLEQRFTLKPQDNLHFCICPPCIVEHSLKQDIAQHLFSSVNPYLSVLCSLKSPVLLSTCTHKHAITNISKQSPIFIVTIKCSSPVKTCLNILNLCARHAYSLYIVKQTFRFSMAVVRYVNLCLRISINYLLPFIVRLYSLQMKLLILGEVCCKLFHL